MWPSTLLRRSPHFCCLTFVCCHDTILSHVSHAFSTAAFASGIFMASRHRNKFVHKIVVTQWSHAFSWGVVFMVLGLRPFQRILTDSSASTIQEYFVLRCPTVPQVSLCWWSWILQGVSAGIGIVRGKLLTKGPDSSIGGVPVVCCLDEVHMEEEEVQVQVQAEEEEIGETHGREQFEEKRREQTIKSHRWKTMRMRRSVHQHLSRAVWCATISACSLHEKKWRVRCTVYTSCPLQQDCCQL